MPLRSGREYSALRPPSPEGPAASEPQCFQTPVATRTLLRAAVDAEDARHLEDRGDTEGGGLAYAADGSIGKAAPSQARDLSLTAGAGRAGQEATPLFRPAAPGSIERKRKRQQSNLRRRKQRVEAAKVAAHGRPGLPATASRRFAEVSATPVDFKLADTPPAGQGAYVGRRVAPSRKTPWTVPELREREGFAYRRWDGRTPEILTDAEDFCSVVLTGQPSGWRPVVDAATRLMAEVRDEGLESGAFKPASADHRRGRFLAVASGVSYGGGQMRPGNLVHGEEARGLIDRLIADDSIRRIASYQNSSFACYAPKAYGYARRTLKELYEEYPWLEPNFDKSIYPAVTFNCGPETECLGHTDYGNAAPLFCAITALGDYDPTQGGHLVLFPLKLIVEFPPGATILVPSATIAHGNTPIRPGEHRMSMTQYCAGGLFRWVEYGLRSAKSLLAQKGGAEARAEIDASRATLAMGLFSKSKELSADRVALQGEGA